MKINKVTPMSSHKRESISLPLLAPVRTYAGAFAFPPLTAKARQRRREKAQRPQEAEAVRGKTQEGGHLHQRHEGSTKSRPPPLQLHRIPHQFSSALLALPLIHHLYAITCNGNQTSSLLDECREGGRLQGLHPAIGGREIQH